MYHKKKLALFISHIYDTYQTGVIHGAIDRAAQYGYRLDVYTTNDGEELGTYLKGEISFLDIPDFDMYAGALFVSGTYASREMYERVRDTLQGRSDLPVVEINDMEASFPCVRVENNDTTGELTEHLIREHGCRRLCYLGCSNEPFYSDKRKQIFLETLTKYHLKTTVQDILSIDESDGTYEHALHSFTQELTDLPDAVVCYNDRLAIRFWECAVKANISIPEQIRIVGCDDIEEGQNMQPPLTTVSSPRYEAGSAAVDLLQEFINSAPYAAQPIAGREGHPEPPVRTIHAHPLIKGSCGCRCGGPANPILYHRVIRRKVDDLEQSILRSFHMSSSFSLCRSLEEGLDVLEEFIPTIADCTGFYLCLYPTWDRLSSKVRELTGGNDDRLERIDERILAFAWQEGSRLPKCTFRSPALLPAHIEIAPEETHFISPLFFEDRIFGYMIIAFQDHSKRYPFNLLPWMMNISQLLENQRERRSRHVLTEHLEDIYLKDVLTDLYNRHGFNHFTPLMLERIPDSAFVSLIFFEIRELQQINTRYSHREGDFVIRIVGTAVKNSLPQGAIGARFGSGEFYVFLEGDAAAADLTILRVRDYLTNYTSLSPRPYDIKIDAGTASCKKTVAQRQSEMDTLFGAAQRQLYEAARLS